MANAPLRTLRKKKWAMGVFLSAAMKIVFFPGTRRKTVKATI
jgi:hypothetical protein